MNSSYQNPFPRVLVTGATGIVGVPIIKTFLEQGSEVIGLSRSATRPRTFETHDKYRHVRGDIRDRDLLVTCMLGVDLVVHAAGAVHGSVSVKSDFFSINVDGVRAVVEAAKEQSVRFVHISSVNAIGFKENRLRDSYAESKSVGEDIVLGALANGLEGNVLRPATVFGHESGISGFLVERILAGRLKVLPASDRMISPVWSYDLARAVFLASQHQHSGKAFTIAGSSVQTGEFVQRIARLVERKGPMISVPASYFSVPLSIAWKMRRLTGWTPPVTVESLKNMSVFDGSKDASLLGIEYTPLNHIFKSSINYDQG